MKLNYKRTFFVGFAFMAICAFWQVYDSLVPKMLTLTFGMSEGAIGAGGIMALDNILALFMLPLFGALSDKTRTRIGKRIPYVLFGTIVAAAFMLLMPIANQIKSLALFVGGLLVTLFAMSTYRSPAVALMPSVTPKPLRSKANAVINLMGALGGIVVLCAISMLVPAVDHPNYIPVFAFVAGFMLLSLVVLLLTINENKLTQEMEASEAAVGGDGAADAGDKLPPAVRRSFILILCSVFLWFMGYNAITTWFSTYGEVMWGLKGGSFASALLVAQVAAILSYIPVGIVASRVGRRKTILAGIVVMTAAFGTAAFFKTFTAMVFVLFAMAGIGWATINVNSYPMVVEMSTGTTVGKYTGYYYTFSMAAQIVTPMLSGEILKSDALGYGYLFPYGAFFVAMSFVTMLFVRHGDSKPAAAPKLEAYDVGD